MTTILEQVPEMWRTLLIEILDERRPDLLETMDRESGPTLEELHETKRVLQREFVLNLDEDSEPTPRGREIDELTGDFIHRFIL